MNKYEKLLVLILCFVSVMSIIVIASFYSNNNIFQKDFGTNNEASYQNDFSKTQVSTSVITPQPTITLPSRHILENEYHVLQSFNNCGPASLSMALSHFNVVNSQSEIGQTLRPWQNPQGDNDDKSVTLSELAQYAQSLGFKTYHRPAGNTEIVKKLLSVDLPVITRTLLTTEEDIGHYRVIKGYDSETASFLQDDSLQGKNIWYTYDEYNDLWKQFNYEYLVLVPPEKVKLVEAILGEFVDEKYAWQKAIELSQQTLIDNPNDVVARFNLSVAYYHTNRFEESIGEYEKVASNLPFRTLWYQIEPIQAYYELGKYEKVFDLTNQILSNQNRAFSELYMIRGDVFMKQKQYDKAIKEYENAILYNSNLSLAKEKLNSVMSLK